MLIVHQKRWMQKTLSLSCIPLAQRENPKGVLHTTGGYLVFVAVTHKLTFDYHEDDIFWCTADIGWVTGHSYIVYGPLCNGATTIVFEGVPTYPDPGRFWDVVEKYNVTLFYTAPTAIRAIAKEGDEYVKKHDIRSTKTLRERR